jgi:tetratricopeptide (TPR) repeat protein
VFTPLCPNVSEIERNKKYNKAIINYQVILKTDEYIDVDFYQLGYSYYLTKKYINAITYLKKYEMLDSTDALTKQLIAESYAQLEDYPSAIKYLKKTILLDESNVDHYINLSWYYLLIKQAAKAQEYVRIGLSLIGNKENESYIYLKSNEAHCLLMTGKFSEAKELYLKYKGKLVTDQDSWEALIIKDLKKLKSKKVWTAHIDELINLLNH